MNRPAVSLGHSSVMRTQERQWLVYLQKSTLEKGRKEMKLEYDDERTTEWKVIMALHARTLIQSVVAVKNLLIQPHIHAIEVLLLGAFDGVGVAIGREGQIP